MLFSLLCPVSVSVSLGGESNLTLKMNVPTRTVDPTAMWLLEHEGGRISFSWYFW